MEPASHESGMLTHKHVRFLKAVNLLPSRPKRSRYIDW